jgi:aldose 1-epimerase
VPGPAARSNAVRRSNAAEGGRRYCQCAGFTLETQKFPDSPRFAHFPTTTVRAGEAYRHEMVLDFSVD